LDFWAKGKGPILFSPLFFTLGLGRVFQLFSFPGWFPQKFPFKSSYWVSTIFRDFGPLKLPSAPHFFRTTGLAGFFLLDFDLSWDLSSLWLLGVNLGPKRSFFLAPGKGVVPGTPFFFSWGFPPGGALGSRPLWESALGARGVNIQNRGWAHGLV